MKKTVVFMLLCCMLLSLASCQKTPAAKNGSETVSAGETGAPAAVDGTADPANEAGVRIEALSTAYGEQAVSDGEYVYFTVHSNDDPQAFNPNTDGLYRADLSLKDPVRLARGECRSPVLDGELVYFFMEDEAGTSAVCSVDKNGSGIRRIVRDAEGAQSLGLLDGRIFYVQDGALCTVEDTDTGEVGRYAPTHFDVYQRVLQAQPTGDGRIWLSAQDPQDLSVMLYIYEPAEGKAWSVVSMVGSFAAAGDTVYFFLSPEERAADADYRQFEYVLMKMGWDCEPSATGLKGRFGGELLAYGQYLFYTKYTEVEEKVSLGEVTVRKLYCYDTQTGAETALPRDEFIGIDISPRGITAGRLFYYAYDYFSNIAGDEEFLECCCCDLAGSGQPVVLNPLAGGASDSPGVTADDIAVKELIEQREREREEELKNTPYGPGSSTLYLKAEKQSACFRLVRMDGTTEFMVLLAPGESVTKTFLCGKYILKVARGETWISDEEAFGPSGKYSTTDAFNFESGGAYEISTGTHGSFRGDSQSGFTD